MRLATKKLSASETTDVWLHGLATDARLKCGETRYKDKFGCEKPAAK